jgi:hypothetical protein
METMLHVAGHGQGATASEDTRESLRVRFRNATRQLRRWKSEVDSKQADLQLSVVALSNREGMSYLSGLELILANGARQRSALDDFFAERRQAANHEAFFRDLTGSSPFLTDRGTDRLASLPARAPFTKALEPLDVAISVGHHGLTAVYATVMDLWSRRHVIPRSDASKTQQPRQRRSIGRLCLALMRFVVGFFGSRKVDARNNP